MHGYSWDAHICLTGFILFSLCVCVLYGLWRGGVGVDGYIHASVNMWRYVMWVGNVWVGTCMPPCIYGGV